MEKINLVDFKFLLICPSDKWSSLERRAVFDAIYLRNIGASPTLLCYKKSQVAIEAEKQAIPVTYIKRKKNAPLRGWTFFLHLRQVIAENEFDVVHCYHIFTLWSVCFILKRDILIPVFFTFNQTIQRVYHKFYQRWLLKRVDNVFALSQETKDIFIESFYISPKKVCNIGFGLDVLKKERDQKDFYKLGCVVDNKRELKRIKYIVKVFRFLKNQLGEKYSNLSFYIFLGPRVFQQEAAKNTLTELDYEFYEGDIMLYGLEDRYEDFKQLDLLLGVAFDELVNDYEIISLINDVPVLFPRTAARQSLLFRYGSIGESYFEGDVREACSKISKILNNYETYVAQLRLHSGEIYETHGVDTYASEFEELYLKAYVKRKRLFDSLHKR